MFIKSHICIALAEPDQVIFHTFDSLQAGHSQPWTVLIPLRRAEHPPARTSTFTEELRMTLLHLYRDYESVEWEISQKHW